ncbi:unnamed protein product [Trichobilharzia regenti]|nr:unnamed protein product [Trichobilharzia regenti]
MILSSVKSIKCVKTVIVSISTRSITIGDRVTLTRRITIEDVKNFAKLTGDMNPVHLDAEYAKQTRYGKCIVHGILVQG